MLQWEDKVMTLPDLAGKTARWRNRGWSIAFTNGCFDIIHAGHVRYLMFARSCADVLVVGLNSDHSVAVLKGPGRPVNCQEERAEVLAALACVDAVVIFNEPVPGRLIRMVKPEVYVKGGDYLDQVLPEAVLVRSYGGKVIYAKYHSGISTSSIITRVGKCTEPRRG